ncbi:TRAM domain-containing protein [Aldersonia sp. NBC_00410]|uniref:class I SAM-dependent RNA methyltransferase n=1 Tax=Aldersonia sp. NBC_00410 TaxID=2975954 RepID=UPI002255F8EA|nr:TRAM domain-containing protein [Aldersonia sp. NBC_00410]MCX5042554.1 TRAM domain-containing protein [Aldersonia sp. NBC_00410]
MSWLGDVFEVRLGKPGHGGFCVGRHEGRVVFVRHGLPGELVAATVTEDRGGSFCRADATDIVEASADRIPALCPVSGPGGAGCCDFSHATLPAQRAIKASVLAEQLQRVARIERTVQVEELPETGKGSGWRTRVRLAVDSDGRAGVHRYRSTDVIADLRCPQPVPGALADLTDAQWEPGAELQIAVDGSGARHVVALAPVPVSRTGRASSGRRGAMARRAAANRPRRNDVAIGSGRAREIVAGRTWEVDATGFWQAHRTAAQTYSDVVAQWAAAPEGATGWDLYSGVGVFAARLAEQVGPAGAVRALESSRTAVDDGSTALVDLPQVQLSVGRVERALPELAGEPAVVVIDPPRAGAGRPVVSAIGERGPQRVVHIGCDPASFARDVALYAEHGYELAELRAFDAFPLTHHVECIGLLTR